MSENALSAHGTLVYHQPSGTGPFFVIGELRDISGPELMRNMIDVTAHNDDQEHFTPGMLRKGEMTFQVGFNLEDASHERLRASLNAGSRDIFRVETVDGAQQLFSGFVANLSPTMPVDDAYLMDVTIRPTATATFIPPA